MNISEKKPNYINHFKNYLGWCEKIKADPANENTIVNHLKQFKDNEGKKERSSATVRIRLLAINHNLTHNKINLNTDKLKQITSGL